jgi:large subunit ribosomal protein L10
MTSKTKPETHVSDSKKKLVKDLAGLLKNKTIMIVSVKGLPSSQFQEIRKKLRDMAEVKVAKKSLIDFALEHSGNKELNELTKYVDSNTAILFSEKDAFELSGFLADNKSPAKAKAGQISDENISIEAGPTELLPGPAITELSSVGLKVKVEGGKIAIMQSLVLVRKGEEISEAKAGILSKLNITPFKIGLEPIAAFLNGKIYTDIKIDKAAALIILKDSYARAFGFAVNVPYLNPETLPFILGKAAMQEKAIEALIKIDAGQPVSQSN